MNMPLSTVRVVPPTHAYVGYDKGGRPTMVFADAQDTRRECAMTVARVIRAGGHVEYATMAAAQLVAASMYRGGGGR